MQKIKLWNAFGGIIIIAGETPAFQRAGRKPAISYAGGTGAFPVGR
jgi:hypothetical protein